MRVFKLKSYVGLQGLKVSKKNFDLKFVYFAHSANIVYRL